MRVQRSRMSGSAAGPSATDGKGEAYAVGSSTNIRWHEGAVSRDAREAQLGQKARRHSGGVPPSGGGD